VPRGKSHSKYGTVVPKGLSQDRFYVIGGSFSLRYKRVVQCTVTEPVRAPRKWKASQPGTKANQGVQGVKRTGVSSSDVRDLEFFSYTILQSKVKYQRT